MRKRYRRKQRSCALCKPHKRGRQPRWSAHEQQRLGIAEREMRAASTDTAVSG